MYQGVSVAILIAVSVLATGCATKEWVQELLGKQKAELGGRVAGVEGRVDREAQRIDNVEVRVTEEAQRVEGMGFRTKALETSVGEVRETAKTAKDRADEAFAKAEGIEGKWSRFSANRYAQSLVETVHVYFAFDRWDLDDRAQTELLSLVKELKENPGLTANLEGYTDHRGRHDYNVQLSQRRVEAVRRFLLERGVEMPRIHWAGFGPFSTREAPARQRRVTVKLMLSSD